MDRHVFEMRILLRVLICLAHCYSLKHVSIGDLIFFNDGKIGGVVTEIHPDFKMVEITQAKKKGS